MRKNIILECEETHERIYLTSKNTRNTPERLALKKYSPKLKRKVLFKETKQEGISWLSRNKKLQNQKKEHDDHINQSQFHHYIGIKISRNTLLVIIFHQQDTTKIKKSTLLIKIYGDEFIEYSDKLFLKCCTNILTYHSLENSIHQFESHSQFTQFVLNNNRSAWLITSFLATIKADFKITFLKNQKPINLSTENLEQIRFTIYSVDQNMMDAILIAAFND